jgi:Protein of unknown function (DUF3892)
MPIVTRTRKQVSSDGTHQHIEGVCTSDQRYYMRAQVVAGLERGEVWETDGGGGRARIREISYCPHNGCYLGPYITTAPDHTSANNLDNLPPC